MAAQGSESGSSARRAPQSSISQYFLVVLFVFGVLMFIVNLQQGSQIGHQKHHISSFQDRHLIKSHSASRKDYDAIPDDEHEEKTEHYPEKEEVDGEDGGGEDGSGDIEDEKERPTLAGLKCDAFGGPSEEVASEMIYWEDIPSDNTYISPFQKSKEKQYITFEADHGGWNNIRMAMETVMTMAVAMGRTLVLPPEQGMYLLHKTKDHKGSQQRKDFSFAHFFPMELIAEEHVGFEVITMEEFLVREGLAGNLRDSAGQVRFPPKNMTQWDGQDHFSISNKLEAYLLTIGKVPEWDPEKCMASFPSTTSPKDIEILRQIKKEVDDAGGFPGYEDYVGKPHPVDAPPKDRMMENWAGREALCIYDEQLQNSKVIHFTEGDGGQGARLLVHFYAFLFFQDWKADLWMKRFVRDHVRYIDEIQCAAARVVEVLRKRARERHPDTNPDGAFDTFHIRRGDFQYKVTRFDAPKIVEESRKELTPNATVYIATDEHDRAFFDPMAELYDVVFLDDVKDVLEGVNTNYYGMIDQLVASRGRIFFGCWFSTFTGYINRLRGYHANKGKTKGYEDGIVPSYYYALVDRHYHMQTFYPVKRSYYAREFPASWRLIDKGIGEDEHLEAIEEK